MLKCARFMGTQLGLGVRQSSLSHLYINSGFGMGREMKFSAITGLLLVCLHCSSGQAQEWQRISGSEKYTDYLDVAGIRQTSEGFFRVWLLKDYATPKIQGQDPFQAYLVLMDVDCEGDPEPRLRLLSRMTYEGSMATGRRVSTVDFRRPEWVFVERGRTLEQAIYDSVCLGRAKQGHGDGVGIHVPISGCPRDGCLPIQDDQGMHHSED